MTRNTEYLGLTLDDEDEFYSVEKVNRNMEIIDENFEEMEKANKEIDRSRHFVEVLVTLKKSGWSENIEVSTGMGWDPVTGEWSEKTETSKITDRFYELEGIPNLCKGLTSLYYELVSDGEDARNTFSAISGYEVKKDGEVIFHMDLEKEPSADIDIVLKINRMGALEQENRNLKADFGRMIDMIYPVGSIYTSTRNVSPENFLGGTWIPVKDMFLLCAGDIYKAGTTGGSAVKEIPLPVHNHRFTPSGSVSSTFSGNAAVHGHSCGSHQHDMQNHHHYFGATTSGNGSHKHSINMRSPNSTQGSLTTDQLQYGRNEGTGYANGNPINNAGHHDHTVGGNTGGPSTNGTGYTGVTAETVSLTPSGSVSSTFSGTAGITGNAGTGSELNIMPPYKTVYAWERTA